MANFADQNKFNKEKVIAELIMDPAITSEWIHMATEFVEASGKADLFDKIKAANISALQIEAAKKLVSYFDNDHDKAISFVINNGFNETQLQVIIQALGKGLTVERILKTVDKNVPYAVMNWILAGLADGFDKFEDKKYLRYHPDQLQEIYAGLKDKIGTWDYDNPEMDAKLMHIVRYANSIGLNAIPTAIDKVRVWTRS